MENCCSCYHTEFKTEYRYNTRGEYVGLNRKIGKCWGTKECDECFCKGDRTKCDFYPDVRLKAEKEEIENSLNDEIAKAIELLTKNGYKVSKEETPKTLKQKLSDIVYDALDELDVIKSNNCLDYDTHSEIQGIICNIYNRFIEE